VKKKQRKKEAAAKEREKRKKEAAEEEAYIKSHSTTKQIQEAETRRKQMEKISEKLDPVACSCGITVVSFELKLKNNKPDFVSFKIEVYFDYYQWVIYRRFKQIATMDFTLRREAKIQNALPVSNEDKKLKYDKNFLEERRQGLSNYFQLLNDSRKPIFANSLAASAFVRFISPLQYGDEKVPGFVLPFNLEEYLS